MTEPAIKIRFEELPPEGYRLNGEDISMAGESEPARAAVTTAIANLKTAIDALIDALHPVKT